jgi:hypothetical protein
MAMKPMKKPVAKKTVAKVTAKKTAVKPSPKPTATSKSTPKKNAAILKKGGLAPASQQVKIKNLKSELKYSIDSDWSANHPIKARRMQVNAEKELMKIYKKLGYTKISKAEDFNYNSYSTPGNKIGKQSESWRG